MHEGNLLLIYSCDPFIVYKVNKDTGICEIAIKYEPEQNLSRFRGSAPPIPFDDGYLFVVHEVITTDKRYYTHRFVFMNNDFRIIKLSEPFVFQHKGVEFCSGMDISHSGKECILSIGIEDKEAYLCSISCDHIRSLLEPLEISKSTNSTSNRNVHHEYM